MQTTLFKITFDDGRIFKVFCANSSQIRRIFKARGKLKMSDMPQLDVLENGIHTIKQWEDILKNNQNKHV